MTGFGFKYLNPYAYLAKLETNLAHNSDMNSTVYVQN